MVVARNPLPPSLCDQVHATEPRCIARSDSHIYIILALQCSAPGRRGQGGRRSRQCKKVPAAMPIAIGK
jgi:hypothetical protein